MSYTSFVGDSPTTKARRNTQQRRFTVFGTSTQAEFMKYFPIIVFILASTCLYGQDSRVYLDTANHFSISIPTCWIVEPRLGDQNNGLSVRLSDISEGGIVPSFHVSITPYENTTLEKYYKNYCRPFDSPNEDREIIQEGNYNKN